MNDSKATRPKLFKSGVGQGCEGRAGMMREAMRPVIREELYKKLQKLRAELSKREQGEDRLILHRDDVRVFPPWLAHLRRGQCSTDEGS